VTSLVTWIWQGLVVAGAAALLVHLLPRLNAATRHAIWWISLALVIVHPWTPSEVPFEPVLGPAGADGVAGGLLFLPQPSAWIVLGACAVWLCVVVLRGWQIVRSVREIATLKRHSAPFDPDGERQLPLWRAAARSGRACEVRVSDRHAGACALGFWRPVILVPEWLVRALSDAELDQVLIHEHAHLQRYDDWFRFVQCTVRAILGLHPAIWFIGTRIDIEREAACDDQVVARTGAPREYVDCLARVAALVSTHQRQTPAVVPAVMRSSAMLRSRITRLLDRRLNQAGRLGWMPAMASLVALTAVVVASDQMPPLVTFADTGASIASEQTLSPTASALPRSDRLIEPAPVTPVVRAARSAAAPVMVHIASVMRDAGRPVEDAGPGVFASDRVGAVDIQPVLLHSRPLRPFHEAPVSLPAEATLPAVEPEPQEASLQPKPDPALSEGNAEAPSPRAHDSWSAVGTTAARAGTAVAARAQHLGRGIGKWFASVASTAPRNAPQKKH